MEFNRNTRFLIPPFLSIFHLLLGAYLDNPDRFLLCMNNNDSEFSKIILGIIATGAISLIPVGFIISVISISILRVIGLFLPYLLNELYDGKFDISAKMRNYEMILPDEIFQRIRNKYKDFQLSNKNMGFYTVATFEHSRIPEEMNEWILRRWNSFNISIHSCVALLLSHLIAVIFRIQQSWLWWEITIGLIFILTINSGISYCQTVKMIDYQSQLNYENRKNSKQY